MSISSTSAESRPPDPAPEQVGEYKIDGTLGSGGMGTVFRGVHQQSGQVAAIKVLPASMAREPGFIARFNREINAMRQLQSPHIVDLYESGEANGTYYYAMEYVPGETLTDRLLRVKRIPWLEVIEIGTQVCKALKAAHNCGIIHRDLKPSNLLIRDDGVVKLSDFGIAQVFASSKLTVTGGILGTAEYMSPEQAQGKRATKQSDIYSLGAVLYVMLTGRPPFTGRTTLEIAQKHRFAQFDSPKRVVPDVPLWLDEIVCQCLSKKPEDRYPDAYVLQLRLQEVPKKLELKASGTFEFDNANAAGETVADQPGNRAQQGELGGTLVRDMVRAQLQPTGSESTLGKLFDNVWVLVGLLVLVLGTGYALSRWNSHSPQGLFDAGVRMLEEPEGPGWTIAREKYFDPLLRENEEEWGERVQPYLAKIQLYELKHQLLGRGLRREPAPQSPPEAILRQALELRRQGRIGEAREKLYALEVLLDGNAEYAPFRDLSKHLREQLDAEAAPTALALVKDALRRAEEFQTADKLPQARALWRSVIELYGEDPAAAEFVEQAREKLAQP